MVRVEIFIIFPNLTWSDNAFGAKNIALTIFDGNLGVKNIGLTLYCGCKKNTGRVGVRDVNLSPEPKTFGLKTVPLKN